ncbi:23S rRNA (pseudouridine(1915)-N(3))-methyltransferase RlmH [Halovulum dunhuangense]|uniref:Ribosomal RNA large subunit methyltransferase H n=1 Tax=Halovulum dunhuangense TaxID=1505036 RepID=A0A849KYQ2_9RHOB|nr:23S rRNA (pseudouridine(1915)-N(3))-methyltransferase RlmH [Halovulum dunhuangense]NNU78842.1 23S rRNA (pseudouridine(1915)-N(3))-methyltransferase RlmH [Halovulum dunhuangense]
MRVTIAAVGRLRAGPEKDIFDDYARRFERTGRPLGLGPLSLLEVEAKKGGGMGAEAPLLEGACPQGALRVVLDERGAQLDSPALAERIAGWRDEGRRDMCLMIGGADGLAPDLRDRADFSLSFGRMVWPHMLVRVMLAEQLYRAASILAGTPYHRD